MATKRLKELLESRKTSSREISGRGFNTASIFFSSFCVSIIIYTLDFYAGTGSGNGAGSQVLVTYKVFSQMNILLSV